MVTLTTCPICSSTKTQHFLDCKDYTVSRETFSIVSCSSCGFQFTNPRPDLAKIGTYYKSEEYVSHSNTSKGLINKLYKIIRNYTLSRKLKLVSSFSAGRIILDVGCGTGQFLDACKRAGWNVRGIEPDIDAREYGINHYGLDVKAEQELAQLSDASFDIITMWHVLEHVYNLQDRVKELKRLIKKDGVIIIAVPNCSSHDAIYYKESWAAYDLPRHLYHFKPNDIETLFGNLGMSVELVLPMKFDSYYVSLLSEKYLTGQFNYIKAFYRGFKSNRLAKVDGRTYSSQIYIIKLI
jgi:SAM-dependent methyltransferase